jgi:hypothetical protein
MFAAARYSFHTRNCSGKAVGIRSIVATNTTSLAAARAGRAILDDAVGAAAVDSVVERAVVDTAVGGLELLVGVAWEDAG